MLCRKSVRQYRQVCRRWVGENNLRAEVACVAGEGEGENWAR